MNFSKIKDIFLNIYSKKDIYYLVEDADWSIKHDGICLTSNLKQKSSIITRMPIGIYNAIVHYGSINTFFYKDKLRLPHKSNKIIVTWFHVVPNEKRTALINESLRHVKLWHTSCNITKKNMVQLGIPDEKIVVIPLGVSLKAFNPPTEEERFAVRRKLGISDNKIVIGSFQKDGNGWGEGLEPKLIKGPDIFCDVAEQLSKRYNLFILLTGPARGYVKKRLEKAGIPYFHHFVDKPDKVAEYYKALDLYIVTSRIEGGPKAVLESLASGVPLVLTKVGMAPDIIKDGENGFLCEVDATNDIVEKSIKILEDTEQRKKMVKNGLSEVRQYDWHFIAEQYIKNLYGCIL